VLGDVEETIYVVEEDEDEEETIRVGLKPCSTDAKLAKTTADNTQEIRNAVCQRYVILSLLLSFQSCIAWLTLCRRQRSPHFPPSAIMRAEHRINIWESTSQYV
jgi:hypothetical protein